MNNWWDIQEDVTRLKREGQLEEALTVIFHTIDAGEKAPLDRHRFNPWPYEQAAIVFRKLKRYDEEVEVIERYISHESTIDRQSQGIVDRLEKAYLLSGQAEKRDIDGLQQVIYRREGVAIDSRTVYVRHGLVVDVETTGLTGQDETIELAAILFQYSCISGRILGMVDNYTGLREPSVPISTGATQVHSLTFDDVRGHRLDDEKVREIFQRSDIVVAHNASFDRRFVAQLCQDARTKPWYCSMNGIAWKDKGQQSKGLQNLLISYGIRPGEAHRAMDDAQAIIGLLGQTDQRTGRYLLRELLSSEPQREIERTVSSGVAAPRQTQVPVAANPLGTFIS